MEVAFKGSFSHVVKKRTLIIREENSVKQLIN